MDIKVIKTEEEYNKALKRLEAIFDSPVDTPEGDEADILGLLIEKYEDEHYPIEAPDPIEAIKFRMEQMNMDNKDLAKVIGLSLIHISEPTRLGMISYAVFCLKKK